MPWAAGVYSRPRNWVTDKANAINPQAALFDQEMDDRTTGLNNCVTKDGLNKPSATMDWNNQRLTNLAAATARVDAPQTAQLQDGGPLALASVSGTDTVTGSLTPAITLYANLMRINFIPAATNTGAATLNVNSVAARAIVDVRGTALVAGALVSGVPASVVYDLANTRWVLQTGSKVADAQLTANVALLNAPNIFTNGTQTGSHATQFNWDITINSVAAGRVASDASATYLVERRALPLSFFTNGSEKLNISSAGNFDFKAGTVTTANTSSLEAGYKGTPQNVQDGNYSLVLTDAGKSIDKQAGGAGETITIPANSSVAFPIGTVICGDNDGGGTLSIAITTDTLEDTAGATGTRTVADNGSWVIKKIAATKWRIAGSGIT